MNVKSWNFSKKFDTYTEIDGNDFHLSLIVTVQNRVFVTNKGNFI